MNFFILIWIKKKILFISLKWSASQIEYISFLKYSRLGFRFVGLFLRKYKKASHSHFFFYLYLLSLFYLYLIQLLSLSIFPLSFYVAYEHIASLCERIFKIIRSTTSYVCGSTEIRGWLFLQTEFLGHSKMILINTFRNKNRNQNSIINFLH